MRLLSVYKKEPYLPLGIIFLFIVGFLSLRSIAPFVFPSYYIYIILALIAFLAFSHIEFEIIRAFSTHLFILSIVLLLTPLLIGQVTRGAVRWIPIGSLTIQPSELVKPFLFLFFANYLSQRSLSLKKFIQGVLLLCVPLILILLQPALGMTILVSMGFIGIVVSLGISKKFMFTGLLAAMLFAPLSWLFLAPYQKTRIMALISPASDPSGAGYNSIQSMISVGSGKLFGRGLGSGVQTQLAFLPERHTDFIFASISEEMGFLGAFLVLFGCFFVLYRVVKVLEDPQSVTARAFTAGVFLTLFTQVVVHIGMNMGLFPITGLPLPLVSSGGSSLIGTMTMFGMIIAAKRSK